MEPRKKSIGPSVEEIQTHAAKYYNVTVDEMMSRSKFRHLTLPRQIAMYLCREMTILSRAAIAWKFNRKDHTTISCAISKISLAIRDEQSMRENVDNIRANIMEGYLNDGP